MLDTPSSHHIGLVGALVEQRELADALVSPASLIGILPLPATFMGPPSPVGFMVVSALPAAPGK